MTPEAIGALGVGILKSILFSNHVNAGQVLEKGELVRKVLTLVEDEKVERERERVRHEVEEAEEQMQRDMARRERERQTRRQAQRATVEDEVSSDSDSDQERPRRPLAAPPSSEDVIMDDRRPPSTSQPSAPPAPAPAEQTKPKPAPAVRSLERTGLCVICQDEEANIAIVDCGWVIFSFLPAAQPNFIDRHLAMCRACSELVMSSSRECPLCRTRIVTEARLLRIFKT